LISQERSYPGGSSDIGCTGPAGGIMSDEDRYRRYAKFCREQASLLRNGAEADRWLHLAREYDRLADVAAGMDTDEIPPVSTAPMQQQPMQQQQAKAKPEDEK
jgi:hypothetical protein